MTSTDYSQAPQAPSAPVYAARMYEGYKIYASGEGEVRALDNVSIGFQAQSFTAIMGPSGSGKSTLLQTLSGLDRLTAGAAFIGDTEITSMSAKAGSLFRREHVGFIFQSFNLIPSLNVRKNILLPLTLARAAVDQAHFDSVVDAVGIGHRLEHRPSALSGGEQQRVAVARALVASPAVVFADEPTGNLDSQTSAHILRFMRSTVDQYGRSVIMVTHDPVAAAYADRVVFFADGRPVDHLDDPTVESIIDRLKAAEG